MDSPRRTHGDADVVPASRPTRHDDHDHLAHLSSERAGPADGHPRRLRRLQVQIDEAASELALRHGRAARPSEIARHLDVDVDVVLEGLAAGWLLRPGRPPAGPVGSAGKFLPLDR